MAEGYRPGKIAESEQLFVDQIKQKGGISLEEALSFEKIDQGIWFGPDTGALDLLEKYIWLGHMRYDKKNARFELVPSE
jgi:hypothetical protein